MNAVYFSLNFRPRPHVIIVRKYFGKKPRRESYKCACLVFSRASYGRNHSSVENHYAVPVSRAVIIADFSLLVIGSFSGAFGNGRACLLFWKRKDLRKAPQVLFVNLSEIGFLSSLVSIFALVNSDCDQLRLILK